MTQAMAAVNALSPGANLESYMATISAIPVLTPVQERELSDRLYYEQDLEAARLLVMSHLRFVAHIARSYSGYGLNQADLIQEGNVGLRSEEHTSELQSRPHLVCRLLLEKKKNIS